MTDDLQVEQAEAGAAQMAADVQAKARRDRLLVRLASLLLEVRRDDEPAIAELLCAWLDYVHVGMPDHDPFGQVREDAAFWAEIATPAELVAYGSAALRGLQETGMAAVTRKRLFVALWETMSEADRRAFIARVDPQGRFRGRAA